MIRRMKITLCPIFLLIFINGQTQAQDSHYWINSYGSSADLLGGIVVGSIKDLSSTFYNPGAIALTRDISLVLTTDAFEFTRINLKNGLGQGKDLQSDRLSTAPSMFAVRLTYEKLRRHHFALSYLTRYEFEFELRGQRIDPYNPNLPPGDFSFAGEAINRQRMFESWGGFTWAYRMSDRLGIGITQFFAYRNQRDRSQAIAQWATTVPEAQAVIFFDEFSFYHVRTLWKIGLAIDRKPFTVGFTVTTPSIGLFGEGWATFNASLIEVDPERSGDKTSSLASNFQDNIPSDYRSPLSLAGGLSYQWGNTTFHFSAEWFGRVRKFQVLETEDFFTQTSGSPVSTQFVHEFDEVFNFGFGYQHIISEKVTFYGGFSTDHSSLIPGSETKLAISNWDIIHLTAGSALTIWKVDLTLGLGYSFGREEVAREIDFTKTTSEKFIDGREFKDDVIYRRLKVIIGFSFLF